MKLTITGDAYALTSSIKVKDIQLLKKHNPAALKITDEDKNEKFAVDYSEGKSKVSTFGITFGGATRDGNGYATVTGTLPQGLNTAEAAKDYLADQFGGVVAYLTQLEESIPTAVETVSTARKKFVDGIVVA